ncbi:MAG: hypothetical protein JWN03_2307 [Nocardia sp.]|uniref:alpha/beta hydrolase family esterase n=1 Tax=Nocardia sp. TaxID=1821 RepID=UPI0026159B78|nr:PHB depolymerase family esterase [Nocardia sp.]MCU1642032.1 hypothetical protein [Nocardia sp.]
MTDELIACELTLAGQTRTFSMRPPRDPDAPLVLVLHGNQPGVSGRIMHEWTSFAAHADEWGIAVGYPDGVGGCWADGRGVTTADKAGVDDVAFLRAVIDRSAEQFGTHPDRTIIAGISNGAFMSHRLAREAGERIPVFAAVAGGLPAALSTGEPTHAVSAMLINGTADTIFPIEGGHSRHLGPNGELRGYASGLTESAQYWRTVDRCSGDDSTITTELSSRRTVTGGVGGTQVAAWTVFGGGHTWPSTSVPPEWANSPDADTTREFDAAVEIYRFARPLLIPADARKL